MDTDSQEFTREHCAAAKTIKGHVDTWLLGHFRGAPRAAVDVSIGVEGAFPPAVRVELERLCRADHWAKADITDDETGSILHLAP